MNTNTEVNFSAKHIVDNALHCLKERIPMSHLRCGDGEVLVMEHVKYKEKFESLCKKHLGFVVDNSTAESIKQCIEFGILNSDVLGFPDEHHLNWPNNTLWKELPDQYDRIFKLSRRNVPDKKCSINSHIKLLKSKEIYRLLSSHSDIVIISSRDLVDTFYKKFCNIKSIEFMKIPPQYLFEEIKIKSDFYPTIHNEIIEKIYGKKRYGQLCIFGGGFCGKDLGAHFKLCGGVAIDLGSVFDLWVGKRTRGPGKGDTAVNDVYKL
jgi:hypothetical protein